MTAHIPVIMIVLGEVLPARIRLLHILMGIPATVPSIADMNIQQTAINAHWKTAMTMNISATINQPALILQIREAMNTAMQSQHGTATGYGVVEKNISIPK